MYVIITTAANNNYDVIIPQYHITHYTTLYYNKSSYIVNQTTFDHIIPVGYDYLRRYYMSKRKRLSIIILRLATDTFLFFAQCYCFPLQIHFPESSYDLYFIPPKIPYNQYPGSS